jgi:hypothetical protein
MYEDWQDQAREGRTWDLPDTPCLSIISALYTFTEIYEFASRLSTRGTLGDSCRISITLHRTMDRQLVMLDPRRHLFGNYVSKIDPIQRRPAIISAEDLIAKSSQLSLEHAIWTFQRFGWDNPPVGVLKEDQKKLLERRL